MSFLTKAMRLGPTLIGYRLARIGLLPAPRPINITFSVTHACQSLCKTCNIGLKHRQHPERVKNELKIDEIEKMFKSIGKTYFFNISGGEPFLRRDLPEIVRLALKYLKPAIIHTPTNALTPEIIEKQTLKILKIIEEESPGTHFTIKPSFDAVGKKHDVIRGVEGNWEKLIETLDRLKKLRKDHPNLYVGVGTVISNFSIKHLKETVAYAKTLDVDSYISEVAEQRSEMSNLTDDITPGADAYEEAIRFFQDETREQMKTLPLLSRVTMSIRLVYYDLVIRILREKRQIIPCYAGISNVHINAYGDLWPCAILAYDDSMGNIRDFDYDFGRLWHSTRARKVRAHVNDDTCACHCPLANQSYSNILLHAPSMIRVFKNIFWSKK